LESAAKLRTTRGWNEASSVAELCLLSGLMGTVVSAQSDFKVTLLGTASPAPRPSRFGPSTLAEAGGQTLLFDAGRGIPIRMGQIQVPIVMLFLLRTFTRTTSRESRMCG
jgi:hypothetical protein